MTHQPTFQYCPARESTGDKLGAHFQAVAVFVMAAGFPPGLSPTWSPNGTNHALRSVKDQEAGVRDTLRAYFGSLHHLRTRKPPTLANTKSLLEGQCSAVATGRQH